MPKLESVLNDAGRRVSSGYDIMTERFEITSILQRALVNDAGVFGTLVKGTGRSQASLPTASIT